MNRRMFELSDTYLDTYPNNVPFVKSLALRNIPPKHTPIQTCFFDNGLAGNTHPERERERERDIYIYIEG